MLDVFMIDETKCSDRLKERQQQLREQLKAIEQSARPVDLGGAFGRLSRMDAMQQQQMALSSKKQIETNLALVEQALKRLSAGEYGVCLKCEGPINEKRLQAKPEAPFCTRCQGQ